MDHYVERPEVVVLRVRADMRGKGPAEAMSRLEAKLPTRTGRRFYGAFRVLPEGEEYFACVERDPTDEPDRMGLEVGAIPGGLYGRRKLLDWEKLIATGDLGRHFQEIIRTHDFDASRPEIEFYRSLTELQILVPVRSRTDTPPRSTDPP